MTSEWHNAHGKRFTASELAEAPAALLAQIMSESIAPGMDDLVGWEFAGINTAAAAHWLGFGKFKKGFYIGPPRAAVGPEPFIQGYNVVVDQKAEQPPFAAKPSEDAPKRHGFFRVHPVDPRARDARYPNALLLDYGLGNNGLAPSAMLRDYLVQVYPDDSNVLLGSADMAVGALRIPSGYFVLWRQNPHEFAG